MKNYLRIALPALVLGVASASANATVVTVFDAPAAGLNSFNNVVAAAGATATHDQWATLGSGTSVARPGYTITRNDGNSISGSPYGTLSGQTIDISPAGGKGAAAIGSGVTLQFSSAINAIGFEVGDWGTCCQPSALFISFDGGAPIQVGVSTTTGDVYFDGKSEVFVGAFDDTNQFTKVQFWGDGLGELLVFGGTINYALLDQGTLPPEVPEPASLGLLAIGAMGVAAARRRKKAGLN